MNNFQLFGPPMSIQQQQQQQQPLSPPQQSGSSKARLAPQPSAEKWDESQHRMLLFAVDASFKERSNVDWRSIAVMVNTLPGAPQRTVEDCKQYWNQHGPSHRKRPFSDELHAPKADMSRLDAASFYPTPSSNGPPAKQPMLVHSPSTSTQQTAASYMRLKWTDEEESSLIEVIQTSGPPPFKHADPYWARVADQLFAATKISRSQRACCDRARILKIDFAPSADASSSASVASSSSFKVMPTSKRTAPSSPLFSKGAAPATLSTPPRKTSALPPLNGVGTGSCSRTSPYSLQSSPSSPARSGSIATPTSSPTRTEQRTLPSSSNLPLASSDAKAVVRKKLKPMEDFFEQFMNNIRDIRDRELDRTRAMLLTAQDHAEKEGAAMEWYKEHEEAAVEMLMEMATRYAVQEE